MRQHQISQSKLAQKSGLNQPTIHRILSGKLKLPRQDTLQSLAQFFSVTTDDLRFRDLSDQSLLPVNLRGIRIPLMNARQVGLPIPSKKPPSTVDMLDNSIVVYHNVSEASIAFRVSDRAMEPRFNLGDIIVFDPQRNPGPGHFVAARVQGLEEAIVRQLVDGNEGQKLRPLNPQYPEIERDYALLGRIVVRMEEIA